MKKFEINRNVTRRATAGIFLRFTEAKGIFICSFFLLPLMAFPFDLIFPWVEKEETGTVTRSFPSDGWFGTYFTHEFIFLDSNGTINTAFSFSKQQIPLGSVPLEQSTFEDVRIQGTDAGFLRNFRGTVTTLLLAPGIFMLMMFILFLTTLIRGTAMIRLLSHGKVVSARFYDSDQDLPRYSFYLDGVSHIEPIPEGFLTHAGKKQKVPRSLAFVDPRKPHEFYLWAWCDSFLQINIAQDAIDLIREKTFSFRLAKVFRNLFSLRFRDVFHEFPKYIRENTHSLFNEMFSSAGVRIQLRKLWAVLIFFLLLIVGPALFMLASDCHPFWKTVPQKAILQSSKRDSTYKNQTVYVNSFQWWDSAGKSHESESYSSHKLTEKSQTIEKWGDKYRICGTWSSIPNWTLLRLCLILLAYAFLPVLLGISVLIFRFLEQHPPSDTIPIL